MADPQQDEDPQLASVVVLLGQLVNVANLQTDLQRASNALLTEVIRNTEGLKTQQQEDPQQQSKRKPNQGNSQQSGNQQQQRPRANPVQPPNQNTKSPQPQPRQPLNSGQGLEALFAKYFGKESKYVDPQKGLGRWAGKTLNQKWKQSRPRRYGKTGAKIAMGAVRSLGGGKRAVKLAGQIGGATGKLVGAVTSVVDVFLKARNAVDKWTGSALDSAVKLGEISGSMAQVGLEREIAQLERDFERGERTSGSASKLQKAESERKAEENKLAIVIDNATNKILTILNEIITPVLSGINSVVESGKSVSGVIGGPLLAWLLAEDDKPEGTFAPTEQTAAEVVKIIEARAATLMEAARRAGGLPGGVSAPSGAMPPGRVR